MKLQFKRQKITITLIDKTTRVETLGYVLRGTVRGATFAVHRRPLGVEPLQWANDWRVIHLEAQSAIGTRHHYNLAQAKLAAYVIANTPLPWKGITPELVDETFKAYHKRTIDTMNKRLETIASIETKFRTLGALRERYELIETDRLLGVTD